MAKFKWWLGPLAFIDYVTGNKLANSVESIAGKVTGSSMTGAEKEAMTAEQNYNAEQAEIGRQWEERMANTQYQRSVADMQSAGLNPAMMYGSAGASSTPSAPVASSSSPSVGGADLFALLVQATMQAKQLRVQEKIARGNNATSIKTAEIASEVGHEANQNTSRSIDQQISESVERMKLIAEQTKSEQEKQGLLAAQARLESLTAVEKAKYVASTDALIKSALDLNDAKTKEAIAAAALAYAQKVASKVESDFKQQLYTDEFIDSVIKQEIYRGSIMRDQFSEEDINYVVSKWRLQLIQGQPLSKIEIRTRNGSSQWIDPPTPEHQRNMMRSLGVEGPTTTTYSDAWNTQYFGGASHSESQSYSSVWSK